MLYTFSSFTSSDVSTLPTYSYLNGNTFLSAIAFTIVYVCNLSPKICSVVSETPFIVLAFSGNIGVPVNPNK